MSVRPLAVTVLGATGSIGLSTLDVLARHPDRFDVVGLSAHQRVDDGERMGWQKSTPVLEEREPWDPDGVTQTFLAVAADLPMDISGFVMERLVAATGNGHRRKAPAGRRRR